MSRALPLLTLALLSSSCAQPRAPRAEGAAQAPAARARLEAPAPLDAALEPYAETAWRVVTAGDAGRFGRVEANGLVVPTPAGAVVVDPGWSDAQAAWILDTVARLTGRPAAAVVVTHSHADRTGGLREVVRRGVPVYGSRATAERLPGEGFGEVPGRWFAEAETLELGGVRVELLAPGAGHTRDNIVVYVPSQRLLFGGCFVKDVTSTNLGNVADADVPAWGPSLQRVVARFPDLRHVVPGHGAPGGAELLAHTRALLEAAAE